MDIIVNFLIVHRIEKQANGKAKLFERKSVIEISDDEKEFVSNIVNAYYHKSNPIFGKFDSDEVSYPFQNFITKFIDNEITFNVFTSKSLKLLCTTMDSVPQSTGGYVVFANYLLRGENFILTVLLNNKMQYNIDDKLNLESVVGLDLEKLDVANIVNVTKWKSEEQTYLSFTKGRKQISNYFKRFIGCVNEVSALQSSQQFKKAFLDYVASLDMVNSEKEDLRNKILIYCNTQTKKNEDISLAHISSMISNDEPNKFLEFATTEAYQVSSIIKGHLKTLKTLKFYVYRSRELTIEFDNGLLDRSVFYDKTKNELLIKEVPELMKKQILNLE